MTSHYENIVQLRQKLGLGDVVKIPKKEFIKEHNKLIPLLKSGSQAEREREARDQSRELKNVMKGGALFPKITLEDSKLDDRDVGRLYNAGDNEDITLKKLPDLSPIRWIKIFPEGQFHKHLHLESYYDPSKKKLHIHTISVEKLEQNKGLGTYLFSLLFNYLKYHKIKFNIITLVFYPSIPNPEKNAVRERIQTKEVIMRGMMFYFKVFSQFANFYPMIGDKRDIQITEASFGNLTRVIDDYEDNERDVMVFKPKIKKEGEI